MKKAILGVLFVGAMLASCSSDEPVVDNDVNGGTGDAHYLAVNIVSTPNAGSRSAGGQYDEDPSAKYEDGLIAENTVTSVRFYFFDGAGNAKTVKQSTDVNYYDWTTPDGSGENHDQSVEKQLKAVLLVETKKGDNLPSQILAVVNPDTDVLGNTSLNLSTLRSKVNNYAAFATATTPSFVMANSVYLNAAKEVVAAQEVTTDKYEDSQSAAEINPVVIYVERNVAKVRVSNALTFADAQKGLIKVTDKDGNEIKVKGEQVYVKLDGWNVTATLDNAYESKHISTEWTDATVGFTWNYAPFFRSFWAAECAQGGNNKYSNFNAAKSVGFTAGSNYTYCNENASFTSPRTATQVIIAGTLCKADGTPLTICEYAGSRIIDNANQDALKEFILGMLRKDKGHSHYKEIKNDEGKVIGFDEIDKDDITFKTATAIGETTAGNAGAYYVFATLTEDATKETWHSSDAPDNTETLTAEQVNQHLKDQQHAKIWNSGLTYYYLDIEHLGKRYGVVRNHIYDLKLTALYGLGTPVYDPTEVIYPEKPTKDDTFIAAQINILSWRVVPNDVILDWGD